MEFATAAVREVEPERDALGIDLPEAEGAGAGADAVAVGGVATVRGEVPGHDAFGNDGSPGEVAVAALPGVAEVKGGGVHGGGPAEVNALERNDGGGDGEVEGRGLRGGAELDATGLPGVGGAMERDGLGVGFEEGGGEVGWAGEIEQRRVGGGGLRGGWRLGAGAWGRRSEGSRG